MARYIWCKERRKFVDPNTNELMHIPERDGICLPMVMSDTPEYISPITGKPVEGRYARKEDLKRSGCVEVDPPKVKREFRKDRYKLGQEIMAKARG